MQRIFWYWSLVLLCLFGCGDALTPQKSKNSILGKKTQDIGEFKPEAGAKVSQGNALATDPVTGPVTVLANQLEKIPKLEIEQALNLFNAAEGRYPNTYEEFMTRIIKENNIRLPVLPGGKKFQYDVENHQLVVIEAPAQDSAPANP